MQIQGLTLVNQVDRRLLGWWTTRLLNKNNKVFLISRMSTAPVDSLKNKTPKKKRRNDYILPKTRKPSPDYRRLGPWVLQNNIDLSKLPQKKVEVDNAFLGNESSLKTFAIRWFNGIRKTMDELRRREGIDETGKGRKKAKTPANIASRSDLSHTRSAEDRQAQIEDKTIFFANKGYYGTPLPLIPDIRSAIVSEGKIGELLSALGVSKRFERYVTLKQGPNKRSNRYLTIQYERLIHSIDGSFVKGDHENMSHIHWTHNFYKLTDPDSKNIKIDETLISKKGKVKPKWESLKLHLWRKYKDDLIKYKALKSLNMDVKKPIWEGPFMEDDFNNINSPQLKLKPESNHIINNTKYKKTLRKKSRKYWGIANQLLKSSLAFRMALIKKSLGRKGRWFHRDISFYELKDLCYNYQLIVNKFQSNVKVVRKWINKEMRDGTYKWRPLGTSPYHWRVYTRGLNNLLEVFIAGSWPNNQHGYKTGRGVHTVWRQVLQTVVHAKYILEFDFTGFFNTVRIEAVGTVLSRCLVPKYMIAHIVNLCSVDVENIKIPDMKKLIKTGKKTNNPWVDAWVKTEYIHKFREGYRSIGLGQGFALSPLLSVLTLVVLEDLEKQGIKHLLYADDGLFYSDENHDFLKIAQDLLDKYNIGAHFSLKKCSKVKEDGKWLTKLKLVGLEFDPFADTLSAATRNGATLELKIGALGYFEETTPESETYSQSTEELVESLKKDELKKKFEVIEESDHNNWSHTNHRLFTRYERVFLENTISQTWKDLQYKKLALIAYNTIMNRFKNYNSYTLAEASRDLPSALPDMIAPIRLLKNIDKQYVFELAKAYELSLGVSFPWDILERSFIDNLYWMNLTTSGKEFEELFAQRLKRHLMFESVAYLIRIAKTKLEINPLPQSFNNTTTSGIDLTIKNLKRFHSLSYVPESLKHHIKDGSIKLGEWYKTTINEIDISKFPLDLVALIKSGKGALGYTQVNYHNLWRDPAFATFIARMFQDSLRSGIIKQNFRLTQNKEVITLMTVINRYVGRQGLNELMGDNNRLDIFNSTSFTAHMLQKMMMVWSKTMKGDKRFQGTKSNIDYAYWDILNKIANRRCTLLAGPLKKITQTFEEVNGVMILKKSKVTTPKPPKKITLKSAKFLLVPYPVQVTWKDKRTRDHLRNKFKDVKSLPLSAITRSSITEHEASSTVRMGYQSGWMIDKFPKSCWDTFCKKKR
jgi:hypothetical protein